MELSKPKLTLDTFTLKANYYVVDLGGKHHYFPVKVEDTGNDQHSPQLCRPRDPLRTSGPGAPQRLDPGIARHRRDHPRFNGVKQLYCEWTGQPGEF